MCDAYRGLLRTDEAGHTRVLADAYNGRKLKFTNNAAVAADGTVYFSDTSTRFRLEHYKQDLLEHRPNGRVLRYRPSAAGLELVADGLYFPNGVALAPDESFLLVAQTAAYDILRIPLTGPAAGRPSRSPPTCRACPTTCPRPATAATGSRSRRRGCRSSTG